MLAALRRPALAHLLAFAGVLGVAGAVFAQTRSLGLLGMDAYPIILASRIQSLADFAGTFTERLMDGLYPGAFYRPLLNLSFAADYALWGLRPTGYQLSNVLFFAGCGLALYGFLISRGTGRSPWAALAGVAFYLFHPLLFEVVPYPPRRPELMCSMFMLLALTAEARGGARAWIWSASATLLALASKETALILPVLVFWQRWIYGDAEGFRDRVGHAGGAAVRFLAPVAIYALIRWAVLGGLGGHRATAAGIADLPAKLSRELVETLAALLRTTTSPSAPGSWGPGLLWAAACLGALLAAFLLERGAAPEGTARSFRALGGDLLFTAGWLLTLAVIFAVSGRLSPWYFVSAVVALSVLVAGIFDVLVAHLAQGGLARRGLAVAAGVAVVGLFAATLARWSPIVHSYGVWERATQEYASFVAEVEGVIQETEDGTLVRIPRPRRRELVDGEISPFRGVVHLAHYSLHAWAQLAMPDRQVRVLKNPKPLRTTPVQPTEVVVILDRLATEVKKTRLAEES